MTRNLGSYSVLTLIFVTMRASFVANVDGYITFPTLFQKSDPGLVSVAVLQYSLKYFGNKL